MEKSLGERLKSAREAKKLSISDVHKETNISPMYVEALEEEKFSVFPGETYLIGFLRSYAEFLKLDSEAILSAYRGHVISESETPLAELTQPTKQDPAGFFLSFIVRYKFIALAVTAAAAAGIIFGLQAMNFGSVDVSGGVSVENMKDEYRANNAGENIDNIEILQLSNDRGFVLVSVNEAVQFLLDNKEVLFLLKEVNEDSVTVELLPDHASETISMGQTAVLNIPDAPREVKLTLKGMTEKRAKLLVELGESLIQESTETVTEAPEDTTKDNTSVVAINRKNLKIVFQAEFREKSFLEVYLDGVQKYRGSVEPGYRDRWEACEFIQIKVGNAGGLKARINNRDYVFGKSGQVANKTISWKKDLSNPNLYHIVVKDQ